MVRVTFIGVERIFLFFITGNKVMRKNEWDKSLSLRFWLRLGVGAASRAVRPGFGSQRGRTFLFKVTYHEYNFSGM